MGESMKATKNTSLISVITPTFDRAHCHADLYHCFLSQTWENKELVILDDSPEPSPFFLQLKDDRVHYTHIQNRLSIGEKRNRLIHEARGDVIAHFDDDDLYTPRYLHEMAGHLKKGMKEGIQFIKLSSWFSYHAATEQFFYWDTSKRSPSHFVVAPNNPLRTVNGEAIFDERFIPENVWGFGFSYIYHRSLFPLVSFHPEDNFGEDLQFVERLQQAGCKCNAIPDEKGIALHVIHPYNISRIFPQYLIPRFIIEQCFPDLLHIEMEL
jgi:glycosyltransferase involved in cell wall biosynthesis